MGQKANFNKKNKMKSKLIITFLVIFMLIILIIFRMNNAKNKENYSNDYDQSSGIKTPDKFESIRGIIEYFDSVFISEKESSTEGYDNDIYLRFKYDLYENGESKESWYTRLIRMLAIKKNYNNIQLIDESKNIIIQIQCSKTQKGISEIIINGDNNYFVNHDSQNALNNYDSKNITNIVVNSNILSNLITNAWNKNLVNFGTKESSYCEYDIYFEEGYKVKNIYDKVFNIVFTEKYNGNVVNNISPNASIEEVKQILGEPTFKNDSFSVYGYKGNDIYVFFSTSTHEISVYRVEKEIDTTEFINIIQNFNNGGTYKELGSSLPDLWNDYDYYSYDSGYVELIYSLRGIKLQFNIDNTNGIVLYNNYVGDIAEGINIKERKEKGVKPIETLYFKDTDLVFETEGKRSQKEYFKYNERDEELDENTNISNKFYIDFKALNSDGTLMGPTFISIDKSVPDSELDEHLTINQYFWYDDNNLVYSVKNEGIYVYNCFTRINQPIFQGKDNFNIEALENGILVYDGKSINLNIN